MRTSTRLAWLGALLCLPALVRCGAAPAPAPAPPQAAVACPSAVAAATATAGVALPPLPDASERAALFAELVGAVRRYHLFSEATRKNLGRRWEEDLPALERAFAEAETEPLLRDVLSRFAASLHDGHCAYDAEKGAEWRRLRSGLDVEVEWIGGAPRFYVESAPATMAQVRPGDLVVSLNGVPAERFLDEHRLRSNGNNRRRIAADVAAWMGERTTLQSSTREGDVDQLVVRHREGGEVAVAVPWKQDVRRAPTDEDPTRAPFEEIDYARARCAPDLRDVDYGGGYRLTAHGKLFCFYTSERAPFDAHPIVRQFSFRYSGVLERKRVTPGYYLPSTAFEVEAEYHTLRGLVRAQRRVAGLILDLRDNRGGNDQAWFLDWYAPGPYVDNFVRVPRLAEWADAQFKERVVNLPDEWETWYPRAEKTATGPFLRRPFSCQSPTCEGDNRVVPAHHVVDAPVALLVGPRCASACAALVQVFDEYDYGPLIGEPTSASYTMVRLEHPVRTRSGRDLGTLGLALSHDESGKTGADLEGVEVHVDYPVERTFEARARWDADLVQAALRAFREVKFPKRVAALGP
jgi:Peptidase family S41